MYHNYGDIDMKPVEVPFDENSGLQRLQIFSSAMSGYGLYKPVDSRVRELNSRFMSKDDTGDMGGMG